VNLQNTDRIIAACPSLFRDIKAFDSDKLDKLIVPLQFGFECGDGWADLLVELCTKIQSHLLTLPEQEVESIHAIQVKEKYGTLRFYLSSYNEVLESLIEEATERSSKTCEVCGSPGEVIGDSWLYCACENHSR
jgi:hypothetical protein